MSVVYEDRAIRLTKLCLKDLADGNFQGEFDANHQALANFILAMMSESVKSVKDLLDAPTNSMLYFIRAVIVDVMQDREFIWRNDIGEQEEAILMSVVRQIDVELGDITLTVKHD